MVLMSLCKTNRYVQVHALSFATESVLTPNLHQSQHVCSAAIPYHVCDTHEVLCCSSSSASYACVLQGQTALMYAANTGASECVQTQNAQRQCVQILLQNGASTSVQDQEVWCTPA